LDLGKDDVISMLQTRASTLYIVLVKHLPISGVMKQFWHRRHVFACIVLIFGTRPILAQSYDPKPLRPLARQAIIVSVGMTIPAGREALREFWLRGPNVSGSYLVYVNPSVALGIGVDLSWLFFDVAAFSLRRPGVSLQVTDNVVLADIHLDAAYYFFKGNQTRPFVDLQVGIVAISQATYREIVNGVRTTYYDVGGNGRLAMSLAGGAIVQLDARLAIHAELKGTFIHNDPAASFLAHLRAGIQYRF
jgi:hypothetical protein